MKFFSNFIDTLSGSVLLDLDEQTLEGIYEAIINDAIANGQMNKDVKDDLLRILTSNHKYFLIDKLFFYLQMKLIYLDIPNLVRLFDVVRRPSIFLKPIRDVPV